MLDTGYWLLVAGKLPNIVSLFKPENFIDYLNPLETSNEK